MLASRLVMGRVRAYLAVSLDGRLAGPGNDLAWLNDVDESVEETPGGVSYDDFTADVRVMLMGRTTHDVVRAMPDVPWPYKDKCVHVATTRPLDPPGSGEDVRAVKGSIADLVRDARTAAGDGDVYVDGGDIVRQCINANLLDELILTTIPVIVGGGPRLFDDDAGSHKFRVTATSPHGRGFSQMTLVPTTKLK